MTNDTIPRLPSPAERKRLPLPKATPPVKGDKGAASGTDAPTIDPRIQARRTQVMSAEQRRRFRILLSIAIVLVLITGALGLTRSPVLAVHKVNVITGSQVSAKQVLFVSGLHEGQALISLDVARAARRITVLPWVESVRVTRHWPNQVDVVVNERLAVAQVAGLGGSWLVVDHTGRVVERLTQPRTDLIRLAGGAVAGGPGTEIPAGREDILQVAAQIPGSMLPSLVSLAGKGSNISFTLAQGGTAKLCDGTQLGDKLLAINTMLANINPKTVGVLDVCVPSAPVLTTNSGGA